MIILKMKQPFKRNQMFAANPIHNYFNYKLVNGLAVLLHAAQEI